MVLSNSGILILDEATSSVDIYTEVRIHKILFRLMEDWMSFALGHRTSTIRDADI